jgi:hypothetical protein
MLTRLAVLVVAIAVVAIAVVACASRRPTSAPTPVSACVVKTDSLQTDVTTPGDSVLVASIADTTNRPCGGDRMTFVIHTIDPRTARDALDAGIDVLITADPRAVAYAATRADYVSVPLQWRTRYVLALATEADTTRVGELRRDLVTAVRADARPAGPHGCADSAARDTLAHTRDRRRIGYADDDSVARALAERLVALADRPGAPIPGPLAQAYVVGLPLSACTDAIPLIETRPRAIVRRNLHLTVVGGGP